MKVGDLVKYNSKWLDLVQRVGLIVEVYTEIDPGVIVGSPYRVRWTDKPPTIRTWYTKAELELLNESR